MQEHVSTNYMQLKKHRSVPREGVQHPSDLYTHEGQECTARNVGKAEGSSPKKLISRVARRRPHRTGVAEGSTLLRGGKLETGTRRRATPCDKNTCSHDWTTARRVPNACRQGSQQIIVLSLLR